MKNNSTPGISVIIPCRNYARFLGECIQSIIGQSYQPDEIIVIDDNSVDEPEKVVKKFGFPSLGIHKVDFNHCTRSRLEGILKARSEIVCCVDADDILDPFYLENGIEILLQDYRTGLVYSDVEYFGLMNGKSDYPHSSLYEDIHRQNFIHAGAILKRDVALLTDAYIHPDSIRDLEDWFTWKKLLRHGYRAVKQPSLYRYRRHEDSYSVGFARRNKKPDYYDSSGLSAEKISIVMVLNEKLEGWEEQKKFITTQEWKSEYSTVILIYPGTDQKQIQKIKEDIFQIDLMDVRLYPVLTDPEQEKKKSEYLILGTVAEIIDTDYFLFIDDGIIPPGNVIEKLLRSMCENTVSVCTNLPVESIDTVPDEKTNKKPVSAKNDVIRVVSNPFSCVLLRTGNFREVFNVRDINRFPLKKIPELHFYSSVEASMVAKTDLGLVAKFGRNIEKTILKPQRIDSTSDSLYGETIFHDDSIQMMTFDEEFYLRNYPDVHNAVNKGVYKSGEEHFKKYGRKEGRRAFYY